MRTFLIQVAAAAMLLFFTPALALDGGFDCAEGADEDLVTEENVTARPSALTMQRVLKKYFTPV